MAVLTPSQVKSLCAEYGLTPSKQYGQNYLISEKSIEAMLTATDFTKDATVVEIGPGFGILTDELSERAGRVVCFEIEQKLRPYWEEKQRELSNVEIVWGNVLTTGELISKYVRPPYTVVANLPYQITSKVLRLLLGQEEKPERIIVMVQKEVAERICAGKGDMSLLALSVQFYGEPRIVCHVPRGSFWPVPKVDSAVVAIDLSPKHLSTQALKHTDNDRSPSAKVLRCCSVEVFFRIARAGFAQKRKQLWKNLAHGLRLDEKEVKAAVWAVAGDEKARAEDLGIEEWIRLVEILNPNF